MFSMILNQGCCSGNALDLYFRHAGIESRPRHQRLLLSSCDFPHAFLANIRIAPQLGYEFLLSYPFQFIIHIMLPFSVIYSELLKELYNYRS